MLFFSIFGNFEYKNLLMKIILKCFLIQLVLLPSILIYAQVGIGTTIPDASSALDVSSTSKGFLMPRLTTTERDNVSLPATGLMIFNTILNDGQLNIGTPSVPSWIGIKEQDVSLIDSVTEGDYISTTSTSDQLVPGMTVFPIPGTYLVLFNAQHNSVAGSPPFSSAQGVIDTAILYDELMAYPGGVPHGLTFGSGEILPPGVYDVSGAPSITGTLTLAGGTATANPVFIIRGSGAFTTGVDATVLLTGNAKPENVFWVCGAAMSTGANTIMKGTMLVGGAGAGALSLGAGTNLEGRMLTKLGALSLGANVILSVPTGISLVNLGALSTFAMWSSAGAVSDVTSSTITGDVGTALGALTIAGMHTGVQYPAGTTSISIITTATYSIYQNGAEVVNSSSTINLENSVISLEAMVTTLTAGEAIDIRWKVNFGEASLDNRILSLIRSGY
jgi:hypothetical protein